MNAFTERAAAKSELLIGLLRQAVQIPSMSGEEREVVEFLAQCMRDLDYDEVTIDPMGNLIGRIGHGRRILAFDGHCDTVDVGDMSAWTHDPFGGEVEEGKLFGRGTSDQTSGLITAMVAAAEMKKEGLPDDVTVYVVASVQEEDCDGLCWQYIVKEDGIYPDMVVLTEPTSLQVYCGQRGRMEIEISTTGRSCHGSAPERGENAVYKMAPVIQDIEKLHARLPERDPLGRGSVTISQVRSRSPSLCAVADGCTIHLDRRLTAGETAEMAVQELRQLPSVISQHADVKVCRYETPSYTGLVYPTEKIYPSWLQPLDSAPVLTAVNAYEAVFEQKAPLGYWVFSTNGVATSGLLRIPSIGFGPGFEEQAHAPDEYVPVDHLANATAFYMGMINAFCEQRGLGL